MATITITIPDALLPRVLDAICVRHGYDAANGQTKAQFARDRVKLWITSEVRDHEQNEAAAAARRDAPALDF